MLVHGFESPYKIWHNYIEHYKQKYHFLVAILPGHDVQEKSEFIYAIYRMSMGGVLASYLWKNKRLTFEKVILESSTLLSFEKHMTRMHTKQYLSITPKKKRKK